MVFNTTLTGRPSVDITITAVDRFSTTLTRLNTQLVVTKKTAQNSFGAVAAQARMAGMALTAMGVVGAVALGAMVREAISFESAFTGVRKTVELTEAEFGILEERFKSMSQEIPVSFQELSSIGEIAGQLGVEGVDNISKFTKTVADISATTNLTAEEAATNFARISNIMQEPIENVDRMGAVIVELGNNFATTESEITNFAMRIAAAGRGAGFTTSDMLAIGAAFSSVGIQAERGGTAVIKVMNQMTEAVAKSTGGTITKDLNNFAKAAGVTGTEFKKVFEEDASKAFELFVLGLQAQGDNIFQTFDDLKINNIRTTQSFRALAGGGDLITRSFQKADKEWKKNNALTEEANKRYETMASRFKTLQNTIKVVAADLGEILFPIIEDVIHIVKRALDWFNGLSDGFKAFIVKAAAVATALALITGPMLIFISFIPSIISGIGFIGTAITALKTATLGAGTAVTNLQFLLRGLAGGVAIWLIFDGLRDFGNNPIKSMGELIGAAGFGSYMVRGKFGRFGGAAIGIAAVLMLTGDEEMLKDAMKVFIKLGLFITNAIGAAFRIAIGLGATEAQKDYLKNFANFNNAFKKATEEVSLETGGMGLFGRRNELIFPEQTLIELQEQMDEVSRIMNNPDLTDDEYAKIKEQYMALMDERGTILDQYNAAVKLSEDQIIDNQIISISKQKLAQGSLWEWLKLGVKSWQDVNKQTLDTNLANDTAYVTNVTAELNKIPTDITTVHEIRTVRTDGAGQTEGGGFGFGNIARAIGRVAGIPFLENGGQMASDGLAYLHQGEVVTPANEVGERSVVINITGNNYGTDPEDIAEALNDKLKSTILI